MGRLSLISYNSSSGNANVKGGTVLKNGDGTTTTFTIPHTMSITPTSVTVGVGSNDSLGEYYYTFDATNISIVFSVPPPTGTNNLVFQWSAFSTTNEDDVSTFNRGTAVKNGDAATKVFTIAHGLTVTPQAAFIEAQSDDAKGSIKVTWDSTVITITYPSAPPSGSSNLIYSWMVV